MKRDGLTFSRADQYFTTTVGKDYLLVFEKLVNTTGVQIKIGVSQGSNSILNLNISSITYYYYTLTATSSATWRRIEDGGASDGA